MNRILTLTINPAVDLSSSVENVFPEHKLRCAGLRSDPGGGGINVSRVIKRLGGDTIALHCSGGPTGQILQELLKSENIAQYPVKIKDWTRQNITILETNSGQQYRFVLPGPVLSATEWGHVLNFLETDPKIPSWIVASGSLPPGVPDNFYARVAEIAQKRKARLILDTSGRPLEEALEKYVYLIKPSLRELSLLVNKELTDDSAQNDAVMQLINAGRCEIVIVSLGRAGVLVGTKNGYERLRAPAVSVCSKVGAGDSMVAGISLALSQGQLLRDAVRLGIATGSAAVMNPGTELCHTEDVYRLLKQID